MVVLAHLGNFFGDIFPRILDRYNDDLFGGREGAVDVLLRRELLGSTVAGVEVQRAVGQQHPGLRLPVRRVVGSAVERIPVQVVARTYNIVISVT